MNYTLSLVSIIFCCTSCSSNKNASKTEAVSYTGQQTIIYKTKADYSNLVPVMMNDAKTEIVAYPAPTDIAKQGEGVKPIQLKDNFWLDNRGVGVNYVFLNITYQDYAKLESAPLLDEMMRKIVDKEPFTEMYNLGERKRFADEVAEINGIIQKKMLGNFRKLK